MLGRRPLSNEEITKILPFLNYRDKALFVFNLKTGFRISESLSLSLGDVIDNYGNVYAAVTVKKVNMKGKHSSRTVPIHHDARMALSVYMEHRLARFCGPLTQSDLKEPLFVAGYRRMARQTFHNNLKQACREAGVEANLIASHSCRKTFANAMFEKLGHNIFELQAAMGHSHIGTTAKYLANNSERVKNAFLK